MIVIDDFSEKGCQKGCQNANESKTALRLYLKNQVKSRLDRVSWRSRNGFSNLSPKPRAEGLSPSAPAIF